MGYSPIIPVFMGNVAVSVFASICTIFEIVLFFLLYNRMLDGDEASSHLDMFSLEMFENIAYIMAKHADPSIPDSPERRKYKTTSMPQARTEKMNCLRDSPKNILSV